MVQDRAGRLEPGRQRVTDAKESKQHSVITHPPPTDGAPGECVTVAQGRPWNGAGERWARAWKAPSDLKQSPVACAEVGARLSRVRKDSQAR